MSLRDTSRVLGLSGHSSAAAGSAPPLSPVDGCRLYYEIDNDTLFLSVNAGPWNALGGALGTSGWTDDGTVVRLTTVTDVVSVGLAVPPADQKVFARAQPTTGPGSVIRAELVGEAFTGIQGASAFRATRVRTAASGDAWFAGYAYEPLNFAGDVGFEVGFHAKPPTETSINKIAFQAEATPGGGTYAQVVQAFEQDLSMRCVRLSTGPGFDVVIQSDTGVGAGNVGGDIFLRTSRGGTAGVDPSGAVIVEPRPGTGQVGDLFVVRQVAGTVEFSIDVDGTHLESALALEGDLTPTALGASQNNYNPGASFNRMAVVRQENSAGANINITGLVGGRDGREVVLINISDAAAETITLTNEDAASTAANRFALPAGAAVVIRIGGSVRLWYDTTSSRWRVQAMAI